ncbi:MAG: hypothetical protein HUJ96_11215 [Marinilabiliaceae bacterium]|nr:hypothetical protein [Marinilabiliaceae bacterium]
MTTVDDYLRGGVEAILSRSLLDYVGYQPCDVTPLVGVSPLLIAEWMAECGSLPLSAEGGRLFFAASDYRRVLPERMANIKHDSSAVALGPLWRLPDGRLFRSSFDSIPKRRVAESFCGHAMSMFFKRIVHHDDLLMERLYGVGYRRCQKKLSPLQAMVIADWYGFPIEGLTLCGRDF